MRSFSFHPGPRLLAGDGQSETLADLLPPGPVLFVTDEQLVGLGLIDKAREALIESGREVVLFDEVEADPSRQTVETAVDTGRSAQVASVVGFGGGSPMDVAKLAAYLLGSGDNLDEVWGVDVAKGQRLPLVLVPTTAGTGSEATPISVITCEGGVKLAVNARPLTADWAVLDAQLTVGLPRSVTAATGIDAIVHAVEAYTSARLKNPISDALAREALRLLSENLLTACTEPANIAAREAMLLGAHLAGAAFSNAPVAGVHALAYPLGGLHHLPHGVSNALMLRHVLQHNAEAARDHYAELAPIVVPQCESGGSQARAALLINRLDQLVAESGIATRLRDYGIDIAEAPLLAREAMKQKRLLVNNPCEITEYDAQRLYEAAW
ncbi:iron-containing alcohol dehydrogenase [Sphingomonas daechungensis]|uniref:Iron-containing alcohol dehydrogenase n=1 Tax=Sphingomonas daechungensis TaxID=1176646 RepID=A0ABX6SYU9_9SPHN|nr:iron-containing alcohol dehydrogenase [Sphingomonas daechungensis]QNP42746.1 iron-containing alcohol dehydrogenase [Sphingomonas daechungensis]